MIGKLDQRVTIQRATDTDDGAGGATTTWADVATVWASVRPMSGREREASMRTEATSDYLVTIRQLDGIRAGDRLLWRERYLNVRFVRERGPRVHYLDMEAELGAAG